MFQYPNQQSVLAKNTAIEEMRQNIGKTIRFFTYTKRGLIEAEKVGVIKEVSYTDYIVQVGSQKYYVPSNDYIFIH